MNEPIDYDAVIHQLQLENEMLRSYMKTFSEMRDVVYGVPNQLERLWNKAVANKYGVLVGLMIIYWAVSIGLMLYDRLPGPMRPMR